MTDYDPLRLAGEQFDARPRMTEAERLAAVAYDAAHLAALCARAAELLGDGPEAATAEPDPLLGDLGNLGDLLGDLS